MGIVTAFAVFIAATATLILLSTSQRDDLVATDYYARELRYQDQIESAARTRHRPPQVRVTHDAARQQIDLTLPPQHASQRPAGLIQLTGGGGGPDREIPLDLDLAGHQRLDAHALGPGLWRVRVRWTVDGDDYAVDERMSSPSDYEPTRLPLDGRRPVRLHPARPRGRPLLVAAFAERDLGGLLQIARPRARTPARGGTASDPRGSRCRRLRRRRWHGRGLRRRRRARQGAKVVLIHDRSRLGGNASSEVKMHIVGADCHGGRPGGARVA